MRDLEEFRCLSPQTACSPPIHPALPWILPQYPLYIHSSCSKDILGRQGIIVIAPVVEHRTDVIYPFRLLFVVAEGSIEIWYTELVSSLGISMCRPALLIIYVQTCSTYILKENVSDDVTRYKNNKLWNTSPSVLHPILGYMERDTAIYRSPTCCC